MSYDLLRFSLCCADLSGHGHFSPPPTQSRRTRPPPPPLRSAARRSTGPVRVPASPAACLPAGSRSVRAARAAGPRRPACGLSCAPASVLGAWNDAARKREAPPPPPLPNQSKACAPPHPTPAQSAARRSTGAVRVPASPAACRSRQGLARGERHAVQARVGRRAACHVRLLLCWGCVRLPTAKMHHG